jgi:integrase
LKCFLNYCLENDLTNNSKFKQIKATEIQTSIFVLEEFEIDNILNLEIENESLKEVRDAFCWLCFTGQRFSDLKALKKEDIIEKNGGLFWKLFQFKNRCTTPIDIPLLPKAVDLFKERMVALKDDDFVFNVISNQKMNAQLKVIGKLAKLEGIFITKRLQGRVLKETIVKRSSKISTHSGRKSFISIALKKGMPITAVQKISGHANLSAMKPYIELSETYIAKTLFDCFDVKSDVIDSQ